MKLRADVAWHRDGSGPGYLLDRRTGGIFGLNRASAVVVEGLLSGQSADDLVRRLTTEFEVFELVARGDVDSLLRQLQRFDLVEE